MTEHSEKQHANIIRMIVCVFFSALSSFSIVILSRSDTYLIYGQDFIKETIKVINEQSTAGLCVIILFFGILFLSLRFWGSRIQEWYDVVAICTSLILSGMLVTGISFSFSDRGAVNIFSNFGIFLSLTIGIAWLLYLVLDKYYSASVYQKRKSFIIKAIIPIEICIVLLCWIPVIIIDFPGCIPYDTASQILQGAGETPLDASNPVLLTLLFSSLFRLGRFVFGSGVAGAFTCVFFQVILNISTVLLLCRYVRKKTENDIFGMLTALFFALIPTWICASLCVMKDTVHYSVFLLYMICAMEFLDFEEPSKKQIVLFVVFSILTALTRKAAALIVILSSIIWAIASRKGRIKKIRFKHAIAIILLILLVQNLVYPMIGASKPATIENLSAPLQQMAYFCKEHGSELTQEERQIISGVFDPDAAAEAFTTEYSDPVKWVYHGNRNTLPSFLMLYFKLAIRHPLFFIKALIACTYKYYYPLYGGRKNFRSYIPEGFPELGLEFFFQDQIGKYTAYLDRWENYAGLNLLMGPGLYSWILIIYCSDCVKRKNKEAFLKIIPLAVLVIGFLFTHVNGESRYAYPLMASTPLIAMLKYKYLMEPAKTDNK